MYVGVYAFVLFHQSYAIFNMANAALRQDVELLKSDGFGCVHIPLCGGKSFLRHIECCIAGDWLFGDKDTARMDAAHIGEIAHHLTEIANATAYLIVDTGCAALCQIVNLALWQSIYFAQLTYD